MYVQSYVVASIGKSNVTLKALHSSHFLGLQIAITVLNLNQASSYLVCRYLHPGCSLLYLSHPLHFDCLRKCITLLTGVRAIFCNQLFYVPVQHISIYFQQFYFFNNIFLTLEHIPGNPGIAFTCLVIFTMSTNRLRYYCNGGSYLE